ncbi:MAG: MBL fold metallo-hydrolase [Rothia sp. (in: high G+C Gram-positive bacteria)]|nr:MBL fold metallo-hydrolase [Rothia sp. (in: high G+C Gram-positive bacteria)]
MKLTKFTHSCVRLEDHGTVLVLDPGNFSEVEEALAGADHILITHVHPDHFDAEKVIAYLRENPQVTLHAPASVVDAVLAVLPEAKASAVTADGEFSLSGFSVKTFGGQHAVIHPLMPVIDNVGYLIDENLFHPGDSFVVPHGLEVKTLLVPIHAPWNKISEVIDFIIAVRAQKAYQIHDSLLAETGRNMIVGHASNFGKKYGTDFEYLAPGTTVEI